MSLTAPAEAPVHDGTPRGDQLRRALEGVIGVPATEGNHVEILRNGNEIFPAMLEAIGGARRTIDLSDLRLLEGRDRRAVRRSARRTRTGRRPRPRAPRRWGAHPIDRSCVTMMEDAGVQVRWFRPLPGSSSDKANHRTHRKVLIVDEAVGFTGGVGIADEWSGDARNEHEWRDTHFRIRGPAVDGLRAAFLDNWLETDHVLFDAEIDRFPDQPQAGHDGRPVGPGCVGDRMERHLDVVPPAAPAREGADPDHDRLLRAGRRAHRPFCAAAERGVDVEILLPGPHTDKRFVQLAGEADRTRGSSTAGSRSGSSSRRCCTRR